MILIDLSHAVSRSEIEVKAATSCLNDRNESNGLKKLADRTVAAVRAVRRLLE